MKFAVWEPWHYENMQINLSVLSKEQWNLSETTGGE